MSRQATPSRPSPRPAPRHRRDPSDRQPASASPGQRPFSESLDALERLPRAVADDFHRAIALARRFNEAVVLPTRLATDRAVLADHDHLPREFLDAANRWGLFSLWIPRLFGGGGMNMLSLYAFMEELSAGCAGLANLIGAHYLGVTVLNASCNLRVTNRLLREVVRGEREGRPCTLSLAWTEPGAGTDQFETPLLPNARVRTRAERIAGGYRVNGSKVFISGGHLATWHLLIAYEDLRAPADSLVMLAVKSGTPGFSTGHKEHKMGQTACVASELVFEDCFVADEDVCHAPHLLAGIGITPREAAFRVISLFPAVTKPGVGAIAAGIARAATETALAHCATTRLGGERLADLQWAQMTLADMQRNQAIARTLYLEAAWAAGLRSMIRPLFTPAVFHLQRALPRFVHDRLIAPLLSTDGLNRLYRQANFTGECADDDRHMSGLGSLVKVACSDIAMENASLALDLMGATGTRHDAVAEKLLRDARLLQIYEGTNEINRVNLFARLQAPAVPGARVLA